MTRFKYISFLMILAVLGWTLGGHAPAEAAGSIKIIINGNQVPSDTNPVIIADRTYVPLRVISENLGAKVEWKSATGQVVINWRTTSTPTLPASKPGENQIVIDGQVLVIPADYGRPYVTSQYPQRTMIPLRAVGEALGCDVNWIQASNTVVISSKAISADNQLLLDLARYQTNLKLMTGTVINSEQLLNYDASSFSTDQLGIFKTYREQLSKYQQTVTLPNGEVINSGNLTIMGNSYLTANQLRKWIADETPRITANMASRGLQFTPIPDLADLYITIGAKYGIRGDIAFCQAAKETGYWQFTGSVQPWQNNYCGLWATGSPLTGQEPFNGADPNMVRFEAGVHGAIFVSPAAGVEAHIQHLYAYANNKSLPSGQTLIDPRYSLVSRGIAPAWLGLNARWAVPGTTYGQSIIYDYWLKVANNI